MSKIILCLLLLAFGGGMAMAAPAATNSVNRVLILESSVMRLTAAKATLIVGPLTRTNGVYVGDFKIKVFPYFFKNDWGRLAINVSDQTLTASDQGKTTTFTGTATSAKNGLVRHVEITATPLDHDHGTVSLWFMAGNQKMIFTPAYHFADDAPRHPRPL